MTVLITVQFTNSGVPALALAPLPTMQVFNATIPVPLIPEASGSMFEIGGGTYGFLGPDTDGVEYSWTANGGTGIADLDERNASKSYSGTTRARQEVDIPAILADTDPLGAAIAAIDAALAVVDSNVDLILDDTSSAIPGQLTGISGQVTTVDANVDLILADTAAMQPQVAALGPALAVVDGIVDQILADTTAMQVTLAAILVDTGTTIPGLFTAQPAAFWAFDIRDNGIGADFSSAAQQLQSIRLTLVGKNEPTVDGVPSNVAVYNDNDSVRFTMGLTGLNNEAVQSAAGIPAKRAAAV